MSPGGGEFRERVLHPRDQRQVIPALARNPLVGDGSAPLANFDEVDGVGRVEGREIDPCGNFRPEDRPGHRNGQKAVPGLQVYPLLVMARVRAGIRRVGIIDEGVRLDRRESGDVAHQVGDRCPAVSIRLAGDDIDIVMHPGSRSVTETGDKPDDP